jgi:hypothetical protein
MQLRAAGTEAARGKIQARMRALEGEKRARQEADPGKTSGGITWGLA